MQPVAAAAQAAGTPERAPGHDGRVREGVRTVAERQLYGHDGAADTAAHARLWVHLAERQRRWVRSPSGSLRRAVAPGRLCVRQERSQRLLATGLARGDDVVAHPVQLHQARARDQPSDGLGLADGRPDVVPPSEQEGRDRP